MIMAGKPETYRRRHRAAYERCPRGRFLEMQRERLAFMDLAP